jgi:hypothetical protein
VLSSLSRNFFNLVKGNYARYIFLAVEFSRRKREGRRDMPKIALKENVEF